MLPRGELALSKSNIGIHELRSDITSGMSEAQILFRYQITSGQLQRLLRRMMVTGYLSELELFDWLRLTESQFSPVFREDDEDGGAWGPASDEAWVTAGEITDARSVGTPRDEIANPPLMLKRIPVRLPVEEPGDRSWFAFVRDLSEGELRAASPKENFCCVGDRKTLVLRTDVPGEREPIELEATCQWIKKKVRRVEYYVAGFEITSISHNELDKLRLLIHLLSRDMPQARMTVFVNSQAQMDPVGRGSVAPVSPHMFDMTDEFVLKGNEAFPKRHDES